MEALNEITEQDRTTERLNEFLSKNIEPSSLAKQLRRANYILAISQLNDEEKGIDVKWVNDSYFWINQLAEILDPSIDID